MQSIYELGNWLMDVASFMPRSKCGLWTRDLVTIYTLANLVIFGSFMSIPVSLTLVRPRGSVRLGRASTMAFCTFILFCGGGHLLENVGAFFYPAYRFFAAWNCCTAVASVATAFLLPWLIAHPPQCQQPPRTPLN